LHVASTQEGLPRHVVAQLERAVALYRGDFLEGFHIPNSQGFDAWLTVEQERLRGIVIEALRALVVHELACGDYMAGLRHVARLVRFDPFQEDARRHMMQLLDLCGQRGAALAHYRAYYSILAEELDTVPAAETLALYERIRVGRPVEP
jgi:DNA-binding SARP family transcriptional activator